ncbi:MAG: hypothetical protein IJ195_09865 [Lachnospiraceae bacterium]|nr:hypothetical protein [Lachnospiraceae bacterium]
MKESFIKKAPYTVLIIVFICLFWGLKALSASGQIRIPFLEDGRVSFPSENEKLPENTIPESKTDEIAFIPATLGEADSAFSQGNADNAENADNADNAVSAENTENIDNTVIDGAENGMGEAAPGDGEAAETVTGAETADLSYDTEKYPYSFGEVEGNCVVYDPADIDSRYYKDCGKIALDTPADYVTVEDDYFDDACFVGDSRMVGIFDYAGWDKADFYCDNGYCLYNYMGGKNVICQNNNKKYKLEDAIKRKKYGKVYIMMGTNDCGYGTTESFKESYSEMLEMIKTQLPDAVIFTVSNMRISKDAEKNDKTGVYRNLNINDKNTAIAELADGERVFYFDINAPFVDKEGYLIDEYTFDGFHVYAKQYTEMAEIFKAHGIKN